MKIIYKNYLAAALHAYLQILKLLFFTCGKVSRVYDFA